jgi:hypothetical protein
LSKDKHSVLEKTINHWTNKGYNLVILHETKKPIYISKTDDKVIYVQSFDSFYERLQKIPEFLKTDYALISPDDEVFSDSSIKAGIKYLEENLDFSTVSGQTVSISKYGNHFNYHLAYRNYVGYETLNNDALGRIKESVVKNSGAMGVGAPYRIMRRDLLINFLNSLSAQNPMNCAYIYEVLAEIYQNLHGKVKFQNNVFWIRNWIIPANKDSNRNFYYFQWWESPQYYQDRELLKKIISAQFKMLALNNIDEILQISYESRKQREIAEQHKLVVQRKLLKRIKSYCLSYRLIQRINFTFKPNTLKNLLLELKDNKIEFESEEICELKNFIISAG